MSRLFPARIDNRYRGHVLGLGVFALVTLQRVAVSIGHMVTADGGAQSIAKIPLDTYSAPAAQNVVGLFARMGLEQLLLGLLCVLVLVRYRAIIPLMYLVIIAQYVGARVLGEMKPLIRAGTSGAGTPALVIAILSVIGLVLSLSGRGYAERVSPPGE